MLWSNWRSAVMVMLASSGLAWGQAPLPTASEPPAERTLTVHEDGQSMRCRLVSKWQTPEGANAYQVQIIATGEMLTIVEEGAAVAVDGKATARSMRIYHWGTSRVPPPGVPVPPETIVPVAATVTPAPTTDNVERFVTIHEAGKSLPCRVLSTWRMPDGSIGSKLQVIATGEMMTIVEEVHAANRAENAKSKIMRVLQWGKSRVPPAGAPAPPESVATADCSTPGVPCSDAIACQPQAATATIASSVKAPACVDASANCSPPTLIQAVPALAPQVANKPSFTNAEAARDTKPQLPGASKGNASFSTAAQASNGDKTLLPDIAKPAAPVAAPAPNAPLVTKKDWRSTWGQPRDANVQAPGQATVDQASAKPGPKDMPTTAARPPVAPVAKTSDDILLSPERFDPASKKLVPRGIQMNAYRGDPAKLLPVARTPAPKETVVQGPVSAPPPPLSGHAAPAVPAMPTSTSRMPPGVQSVLAAGSNAPGRVTYVPVPVATVPDPYRPPLPPTAMVPAPPQPAAYVNAFSAPPPPQEKQQQNPMTVNAFGGLNPQAYPSMQPPMQPPMLPPARPQPQTQPSFPQSYPGPLPPNPNAQGPIQQQSYNPAMERRQLPGAAPTKQDLSQVIQVLRESPYPAQREWASNTLATYDWQAHPEAVQMLLAAAQRDPAPTVRASCVHSLGRMNAACEPVVSTLHHLRSDADQRVRQEVEQTLVKLSAAR